VAHCSTHERRTTPAGPAHRSSRSHLLDQSASRRRSARGQPASSCQRGSQSGRRQRSPCNVPRPPGARRYQFIGVGQLAPAGQAADLGCRRHRRVARVRRPGNQRCQRLDRYRRAQQRAGADQRAQYRTGQRSLRRPQSRCPGQRGPNNSPFAACIVSGEAMNEALTCGTISMSYRTILWLTMTCDRVNRRHELLHGARSVTPPARSVTPNCVAMPQR
jgi:hypothetical protein